MENTTKTTINTPEEDVDPCDVCEIASCAGYQPCEMCKNGTPDKY